MISINNIPVNLLENAKKSYFSIYGCDYDIKSDKSSSKQILYALALSDYFYKILMRDDSQKHDILNWLKLSESKQEDYFSIDNLRKSLSRDINVLLDKDKDKDKDKYKDINFLNKLYKKFRDFRHEVIIRILICDLTNINNKDNLTKTNNRLSNLADVCLLEALSYFNKIYKLDFLVLCLGKLGNRELNFSSDIDLIFCVKGESPSISDNIFDNISAKKMSQELIQLLDKNTHDGFVFRVDMRLRPFGNAGPLVSSEKQFLNYLQKDARPWERYVFMKARVLCLKDDSANNLRNAINKFVYRPYMDFTVKETILEMRKRIDNKISSNKNLDLKTGVGGIRDIEFICQTLQLIHAGSRKLFRSGFICDLLSNFNKEELLSEKQYLGLEKAYIFLRNAENHLQMINNQQVHICPVNEKNQLQLAVSMGFSDWSDFFDALINHQKFVKTCFDKIILPELELELELELEVDTDLGLDKSLDLIINNNKNISKNIFSSRLESNRRYKKMSFLHKRQVQKIYIFYVQAVQNNMLKNKNKNKNKNLNLEEIAYIRISELLCVIMERQTYIALLLSSKELIIHLAVNLSNSYWIFSILKRMPYLMANLIEDLVESLDNKIFINNVNLQEDLKSGLQELVIDQSFDERINEYFRGFRWRYYLKAACCFSQKKITSYQVSIFLTDLAEAILSEVIKICWSEVSNKNKNIFDYENLENMDKSGFLIISYGKLASREVLFSSDLDLVFLYKENSKISHKIYSKVAQKILSFLQTKTLSGFLYPIDIRLRPQGGSGLLVSSISAFKKYQLDKAWVWEHQALSRSRAIVGDKKLRDDFMNIRSEVLSSKREEDELAKQVNNMRDKIESEKANKNNVLDSVKYGKGGLNDIEFLLQYLFLLNANQNKNLVNINDISCKNLISEFRKLKVFNKSQCDNLLSAYNAYRNFVMIYNLKYLDFENNFNNDFKNNLSDDDLGFKIIEKHKKIVIDILNYFIK